MSENPPTSEELIAIWNEAFHTFRGNSEVKAADIN